MELYQFFLLNQQKEHLTEIIQNAENLTFGSVTANTAPAYPILPLPTQYCPCPPDTAPAHPFRRGPQYFPDFLSFFFICHQFCSSICSGTMLNRVKI